MYIDAIHDKKTDTIHVVERVNGERVYKQYPANYTFYYPNKKGKFTSIFNEPLDIFTTSSRTEYEKEKKIRSSDLYESDIYPLQRCISENYLATTVPKMHMCIFDLEVDFDPILGYAPTDDPFNPITAISLYLDWLDQLVTLVVAPKHMSHQSAMDICNPFGNVILCATEKEMLLKFFALIEDADVLTGWNSEGYDIPYTVNRVIKVLGKTYTRQFCLWNQYPKERKYERFGKEEKTYDLVGRVHLDYLQLYKKYNYQSMHSYKLDFIGEVEVNEKKVPYEGTLDQLYNKDFKKFIEYNQQDVMLLWKIHSKLKFMDLANRLAHENTVLFGSVMGSVAMIDQAVVNEAHLRGLIVPDRKKIDNDTDEQSAAGAYVATPKTGIQEWIGIMDVNSLYPSTIRALNMAPETIVGQIRQHLTEQHQNTVKQRLKGKKDADEVIGPVLWEGLFACLEYTAVMNRERETMLTIDYEDGRSVNMSAAQIWKMIFDSNNKWMLSANGTIFTYEKEGVIPGLLTKWYAERKSVQKQLGDVGQLLREGIKIEL